MAWIVTVESHPEFFPPKSRVRLRALPHARKENETSSRVNTSRWCCCWLGYAVTAGDKHNVIPIQDAPLIPGENMVCRMPADFWIPRVFVDFAVPNGCHVKP